MPTLKDPVVPEVAKPNPPDFTGGKGRDPRYADGHFSFCSIGGDIEGSDYQVYIGGCGAAQKERELAGANHLGPCFPGRKGVFEPARVC